MDIPEPRMLVAELKAKMARIQEMDTPENEARIVAGFAALKVKVKRHKKKSPARYTIVCHDGSSIGDVTLADLDGLLSKAQGRD